MSGDHGAESAEIAEGIFGFELEVSGQDLAGGVVLQADQRELGAAALEPVMTTGIGEGHHPKRGRGGRRERYWRGRRFCGDGRRAARKMRRTVSRLTTKFSSARSFSAR